MLQWYIRNFMNKNREWLVRQNGTSVLRSGARDHDFFGLCTAISSKYTREYSYSGPLVICRALCLFYHTFPIPYTQYIDDNCCFSVSLFEILSLEYTTFLIRTLMMYH